MLCAGVFLGHSRRTNFSWLFPLVFDGNPTDFIPRANKLKKTIFAKYS